jgi:fatty acid desaturase
MSTTDPPNAAGSASAGPPRAPSPAAGQLRLIRSGANWFIWIAGLSLVNSALFAIGSNWAFFLGLGATQFVDAFWQGDHHRDDRPGDGARR